MAKRILYAGLFHETHTFIREVTPFDRFEVTLGPAILAKQGDDSPAAGFLETATTLKWEVIPTIDARAVPSGTVTDQAFEQIWTEFRLRAEAPLSAGVDAIFLVLHGAMVTQSLVDPEGEFLARIRALPGAGSVPLFGVLDLHANVTPRMCQLADCLVAYRENPHIDAKLTASRATLLLERCLRTGAKPRMMWCRMPIIWAPPGTGTANDPMLALNALARQVEAENPSVWVYNVAAGFAFADTPDTGATLCLAHDGNPVVVKALLEQGANLAWTLRAKGNVDYPGAATVLAGISADAAGPILLVEPADNIGAGSPGDGTGILRALLKRDPPSALVAINDPLSVQALASTPVGTPAQVNVGGREWPLDEGPVPLEVTLLSRSDGKFDLEDPQSHLASMSGRHFDMGPCAVVRHRGITILLTSHKTPPFDLGQFRSQGIEPKNFQIIGVKAAVAHRRAYDPIMRASYYVDTPGPCSSDLRRFPFKHLLRPVFPLDATAAPEFLYA